MFTTATPLVATDTDTSSDLYESVNGVVTLRSDTPRA